MQFNFLTFLTNGLFVISWYASGVVLALWVIYDVLSVNTQVNKTLKIGWPIIMFFFSVIGLVMYIWTCRVPRIAYLKAGEKKKAHQRYVANTFSKVTGSVIHCVSGDALGIVTAMVISRYVGLHFWSEFTAAYITGFLFGLLLFQYPAMKSMGNTSAQALWKGGRAEFFSMITLMTGMGSVDKFIAPQLVSPPPLPTTYAFWGIAGFALLIGSALTYPMNWWLVSIGWKHGMS